RDLRGARAREPADLRAHQDLAGRHRALRPQRRAVGAGGRARPARVRGSRARRDVRAVAVPADRGAPLPAHARASGILLVPAEGGGVSELVRLVEQVDEASLVTYVTGRRWFGAKSREVAGARVIEATAAREETPALVVALVEICFLPGT